MAHGLNNKMAYKKIFECRCEDDTNRLAEQFAKIARKGDIFALFGTLGAGKSTFSRHFIQFLSGATEIPSPTFTLVQTYDTEYFEVYHYDMYRLKQPEEAYELGIEEAFAEAVNLIEWPDKLGPLLPRDIWKITITTKGLIRFFEVEAFTEDKYRRLEKINYA